ncbi:protein of unknown function [Hyphomicrobium sp. 1Nfss2.1]
MIAQAKDGLRPASGRALARAVTIP